MKKRYVILIILILIIILIFNRKENKNILKDVLIFDLWSDIGKQNEYTINPEKGTKIDIFQTVEYEEKTNREVSYKIHKKIAPGSHGKFTIKLSKQVKTNFKINLSETETKPQNLIFIIGEQKYNSIKQMEEKITQELQENGKIIINWEWLYYNNQQKDIQDTEDGENLEKYYFEIQAIIEEG